MKRLIAASIIVVAAVAASGRADACPEGISFSFSDEKRPEKPVSTPIVILGAGATTEGWSGSAAVGWAWGERDVGWLFPSAKLRRVLIHAHRPFDAGGGDSDTSMRSLSDDGSSPSAAGTRFAVTYGWYETSRTLLDGGLDFGVTGTADGHLGPLAQLTLGVRGLGVRLTGGADVTDARLVGGAEFVLDIATIAGRFW